jgi:hypothetical protein
LYPKCLEKKSRDQLLICGGYEVKGQCITKLAGMRINKKTIERKRDQEKEKRRRMSEERGGTSTKGKSMLVLDGQ